MHAEEGLRERKRRETRARIAGSAMPLFMRRGFDAVSVAEIAAAAGVAEKTVYNYFPVKASPRSKPRWPRCWPTRPARRAGRSSRSLPQSRWSA